MKTEHRSPLDNAVIWELTFWAQGAIPGLERVTHCFCEEADEAHEADRRLYAHAFHHGSKSDTICWARAMSKLMPNTVAGICLHEFGHILAGNCNDEARAEREADLAAQAVLDPYNLKLRYRGKTWLQWVDFGKLLREIKRRGS